METKKCGDCIHADVCEEADTLVGFSRENLAYCGMFLDNADVVEVVRCKDCKYKFSVNGHDKKGCPLDGVGLMNDDDFCSCGERRINNES